MKLVKKAVTFGKGPESVSVTLLGLAVADFVEESKNSIANMLQNQTQNKRKLSEEQGDKSIKKQRKEEEKKEGGGGQREEG